MFEVLYMSLLSGAVGTGIGGGLSAIVPKRGKIHSILLAITAGIMLAMVCFELVPNALSSLDVLLLCVVVVLGGVAVRVGENIIEQNSKSSKGITRGLAVAFAIALHDFPEGMIIGSGIAMGIGNEVSLLIALHNIPEGMAVALPIIKGGGSKVKAVTLSVLTGIPTLMGAVFGYLLVGISSVFSALSIAFASGAMLYVIFSDLIPDTKDLKQTQFSAIIIIGILIGLLIIGLI